MAYDNSWHFCDGFPSLGQPFYRDYPRRVYWINNQFITSVLIYSTSTAPSVTRLLSSSDGITWVDNDAAFTAAWNVGSIVEDIAYNGSIYVAVGQGRCITSPDRVTWTTRTIIGSTNTNKVVWTGTQFVFTCGNNATGTNKCSTSPDGITWTLRTSYAAALSTATTAYSYTLLWTGQQLIAHQVNGAKLVTSPDGITWTSSATFATLFPTTYTVRYAINTGGTVYAFGYLTASPNTPKAAVSHDHGVTWTQCTSPFTSMLDAAGCTPGLPVITSLGVTIISRQTNVPVIFTTADNGATWNSVVIRGDGAVIRTNDATYGSYGAHGICYSPSLHRTVVTSDNGCAIYSDLY